MFKDYWILDQLGKLNWNEMEETEIIQPWLVHGAMYMVSTCTMYMLCTWFG